MKPIRIFNAALISLFLISTNSIAETPLKTRSIYQSKSKWETQAGDKTTLVKLRGTPVVAAMIYTSCPGSCPLMMTDLKAIEKGLSPESRQKIRFAVFSFDSKKDSPATLKVFAEKHDIDLTRWTFFHGSTPSVRELAALLGVRFKILEDGEFDHSNSISILDSEGVIVHQQIGLRQKPDSSIQILQKLVGIL